MVVDLNTPAEIAELMFVLTWFVDTEPVFTTNHVAGSLRRGHRKCETNHFLIGIGRCDNTWSRFSTTRRVDKR